jgi:formylglycine-generating enzyme required for sulfatase activity/serine/threonine protein kinase
VDQSIPYRDLLLADLALVLDLAPARDVAFALGRFWERRAEGSSILAELREVAGLTDEGAARLEAEAAKLIEEVQGDARLALAVRGGIDRSIHDELSQAGADVVGRLVEAGAGASLREVPEGRYRGFQEIGRGGMGLVYLALDTELNRRVAMKVVRPKRADPSEGDALSPLALTPPGPDTPASEAFRTLTARFLQEAWVTGGLEHPGIVPVYELGRTPQGIPYYTMRFVKGERTLERAIEEATTIEDRLGLLEPFLKVCDTLAYAHARGVVHRDLKPANIVLGEFGEVVLIDWGLARVEERPEISRTTWRDRIEELRRTEQLDTLVGGMGTPGYMAPESLTGDPEEVNEKSDLYSLGAILYRMLSGRLPHDFESVPELLEVLPEVDPVPPHEKSPAVPVELSRICHRCLVRSKEERPASVKSLAASIRNWQRESAVDREVEWLLSQALTAWEDARGLAGEPLARQIDRVLARTNRVLELRPGQPDAEGLVRKATERRKQAMVERERAARVGLLRRVAVVALVLGLAASAVVAWLLDRNRRAAVAAEREATAQRQRAESSEQLAIRERDAKDTALVEARSARQRAESEKAEKETALAEVLRLADVKKVRDLVAEAAGLWPIHPDRAPAMADWIERVGEVLEGRAAHEKALAALRSRALPYTDEQRREDHAAELAEIDERREQLQEVLATSSRVEGAAEEGAEEKLSALARQADALRGRIASLERAVRERASWQFADGTEAWQHEVLSDLLVGLRRLGEGEDAVLRKVEARHARSTDLATRSIASERTAWDRTIAELSNRGLTIEPILGLVPLGKDPDSGLHEFAHLGSGIVPRRDPETGQLVLSDDSAIVLVLIPAGTFWMGAQKVDPEGPNYDPMAEADEVPVHEVTLRPYLIAKHEVTRTQWGAMTEGGKPSFFATGVRVRSTLITPRTPVDSVTWQEVATWLPRHRLRLPTEAEWERACRAGTATPWCSGRDLTGLGGVANIADAVLKSQGNPGNRYSEEVDDGWAGPAPVASLRANGFGLHDMAGNVWEWCEDWYQPYADAPTAGRPRTAFRVRRGGSWYGIARRSRSANRDYAKPATRMSHVGFRPACSVPIGD